MKIQYNLIFENKKHDFECFDVFDVFAPIFDFARIILTNNSMSQNYVEF
jgi:hypothetical protein